MARSSSTAVTAYIAAQPAPVRRALREVRGAIRKALPGAAEVISYQIPAYKLGGRIVIYFAGWKSHYALYPVGAGLVTALKKQLAPYELSNKGTVRFPFDRSVPVNLIQRIAKLRAKDITERRKAKPAASKRRGHVKTAVDKGRLQEKASRSRRPAAQGR
jgi:uncharacterized protein YdhG (YjbR/CyaY superfamily)